MKSNTYYSDYIVVRIEEIFKYIYNVVCIFWTICLLYSISHYWKAIPDNWFAVIDLFWVRYFNRYPVLWVIVFFSPFYLNFIFNIFFSIIRYIRKSIFSKTDFDVIAQAKIVNKTEVHGGSSETDWIKYYLFVEHPISYKIMSFEVSNEMYLKYTKNNMIEVLHNPNVGSILLISAVV